MQVLHQDTTARRANTVRFIFYWVILALGATVLYGQDSQISGRILDPSQAAVSAATVSLTRADTGDRRETTSSDEGYYTFPLLVAGVYDVSVQKEGFQSETRKGIKVETGQVANIDVALTIGAVSQTVNVDASAPLLKTESGAVAEVVTDADISNMALLDRSTMQLARLNGFVAQANTGYNVSFAIGGGRGDNTNYFIDGGNVQNVAMGTPSLAFDPPAESIQEFNVNISTYAPELGRTSGGVVQMTTKSGTNQFHGSLYEFFRNDALDANDYFALKKPTLRYNLYGASLGGPLKKDKTFFFFNWEETRSTTTVTEAVVVPTLAERIGNFSADSSLFTVTNPKTGAPYPDNIIPPSQLDPVGLKFAALYPAPNIAGQTYGNVNFVANDPTTVPIDHYVARIDHTFNENNHLYGRFLGETDNYVTASIFPTAGADQHGYTYHDYFYSGSGAWTCNISPTLLSEFRLAFTRRQSLSISAGYGSDINKDVGLTGVNPSYAANVVVNGFEPLGNNYQYRTDPCRVAPGGREPYQDQGHA